MGGVVVFTGKGEWNGSPIDRGSLEQLVRQYGFSVAAKVTPGVDYLVASRTNTVKAKDAMNMGVSVIDYAAFERLCKNGGVQVRPAAAPTPPPPPIDTAALEEIDGFGMF